VSGSSLRQMLIVAQRDYLRTVRRRGFVLATLLLPAGMITVLLISNLAATSGALPPGQPIMVVNESAIELTAAPGLVPDVELVSRSQAQAGLQAGSISSYFVVPAGWPSGANVLEVRLPTASTQGLEVVVRSAAERAQVDQVLRIGLLRAAGLPDSAMSGVFMPINYSTVDPAGQPVSEGDLAAGFLLPYLFTLIFVMSVFITSGYLLQSVSEEKENRVVEIVLSSVPALPLMAGKILGLGLAGLTQIAIWLAAALVGLPLIGQGMSTNLSLPPSTIVLTLIVFAIGYVTYGAIFAAIGALAPTAREGQQTSAVVVLPAIVPVVLLSFFLRDPSSPLVWALAIAPLTAPATTLEVIAMGGSVPWLLVGLSLASQLLVAAVAIILSSRVFRATLLLYGTQPSLRSIVNALLARP
jgi:ABC-2 type transport system permease protein